jgi:LacI family transcriptional regulator
LLGHTDDDPDKEIAHLERMISQNVDGIVLATCGKVDPSYIARLSNDVQIVLYDRRLPGISIDSVACDNAHGGYIATRHLIETNGRTRIACLTINMESSTGAERVAGYRSALLEFNLPFNPEWVKVGSYSEESGYEDALALLSSADRPQAIFAASHLKAIGVLRAAKELGLSVPEDVSLISFDDMPWAPFLSPPLTVIKQPVMDMATDAVECLVQRINTRFDQSQGNQHDLVDQRLYRPKLIIRESCGYGLAARQRAPASASMANNLEKT